jgi:nitrite reductase/ring-hydroxylating ferredoxin subunit
MAEVSIGAASEFSDPGRRVVDIDGVEIGVFHLQGEFFAYLNSCPHLDGPACQGLIVPLTTEAVDEASGKSRGRVFSQTRMNVVCPWHGMEFDIRTGEHPSDRRFRLRRVPVRVAGDEVLVTPPEPRRGTPAPAAPQPETV